MPAKEMKTIITELFPGKWGRVLAACAALALSSAVPIYSIIKSKSAESKPIEASGGLPFKDDHLVMIVKGLDPRGGAAPASRLAFPTLTRMVSRQTA
jgi:hypothetical protein